MPALLIYLLKVNIALVLFCIVYYALLRPLTFYYVNRVYLLGAVLISTLYPLVNLDAIIAQHQEQARYVQYMVIDWQSIKVASTPAVTNQQFDYWQFAVILFWAGAVAMAIKFAVQFYSLYRIHKSGKNSAVQQHAVKAIASDINPFSFWQTIYINPDKHDEQTLSAIIKHELVHVKQWHTLDILLAEISTIVYWFNPGVWLIRKAVRENLEFITDRQILQQGTDARVYQYSLLQTTFNVTPNSIVNHFNISTLKRRIIMMNSRRSSPLKLTRYAVALPLILVIILTFTFSKAAVVKKALNISTHLQQQVKAIIAPQVTNVANPAENKPINVSTAIIKDAILTTDTTKKASIKIKSKVDSLLYIINGVEQQGISDLNPENIYEINVLKNGTGLQTNNPLAKNGVVIVTTKNSTAGLAYRRDLTNKGILPAIDTTRRASVEGIQGTYNGVAVTSHGKPGDRVIVTDVPIQKNEFIITGYGKKDSAKTSRVKIVSDDITVTGYGKKDTSLLSKPELMIRAVSPNGKAPLYILDGKQIPDMKAVNVNDIESISVFKDKSAMAIYGDAGKNGVVVISTKTAAKEKKKP